MQESGFFFLDINNAFEDTNGTIDVNPNELMSMLYNCSLNFFHQNLSYKMQYNNGQLGSLGYQPQNKENQVNNKGVLILSIIQYIYRKKINILLYNLYIYIKIEKSKDNGRT